MGDDVSGVANLVSGVCLRCSLSISEMVNWALVNDPLAKATVIARCQVCATKPSNAVWLKIALEHNVAGVIADAGAEVFE